MSTLSVGKPHARTRRASLTLELDHVNGDDGGDAVHAGKGSVLKAGNASSWAALEAGEVDPDGDVLDMDGAGAPLWSVGFVVTYGAFFFAGAASIAMWSAVTLCLDFFALKYPDDRVGFVFPVVNMSSLLVISLYMVLAGRQLPLEPRVHGSVALYLVFVVMLPVMNLVDMNRHLAYALTIVALMASTICSSVLSSTMYGLGGVFGPIFMQALDGGKGFGAMLLFAFRLALKWYFQRPNAGASPGNEDPSQDLYAVKLSMGVFFGVAFWMVIMTWILYVAMKYTAYAQPMLNEYQFLQSEAPCGSPAFSPIQTPLTGSPRRVFRFPSATATERSPLLMQRSSIEWDSEASTIERVGREVSLARSTDVDMIDEDDLAPPMDEADDDLEKPRSPPPLPTPLQRELSAFPTSSVAILDVFRTAAKPFFTLFLSFFVCLSCFPGIISAIPSTSWQLGDWFPIILVGCYNTGDLIGKNLPVRIMYFDITTLHLPWALQLSFVPFFLAALLHPFSDVIIIIATLALGLITGYVATSSMILAPSVCSEYQKEAAGMIGSLCAIIGLCAGSYNGLALETLVQIWKDL